MVRVILVSRSAHRYLCVLTALAALAYIFRRNAIVISLSPDYAASRLPFIELCAVTAGIMGAILLRPRFWEWDRLATKRVWLVSGLASTIGIVAPVTIVIMVGVVGIPSEVPWTWIAANVLLLCSLSFALAPLVGAALAGGSTLLIYFLAGVLNNLEPSIGHLIPLTAYPGPDGHWAAAVALAILATSINVRTCGATAWTRRMFEKEGAD